MKRIIKNKVYDTNTAHYRGNYKNETLYQKRTGEYFLFNTETAAINPMNYNEASEWAQSHDATAYTFYFEKPAENSEKTTICISIRKDSHEKIKSFLIIYLFI